MLWEDQATEHILTERKSFYVVLRLQKHFVPHSNFRLIYFSLNPMCQYLPVVHSMCICLVMFIGPCLSHTFIMFISFSCHSLIGYDGFSMRTNERTNGRTPPITIFAFWYTLIACLRLPHIWMVLPCGHWFGSKDYEKLVWDSFHCGFVIVVVRSIGMHGSLFWTLFAL